MTSRIEKDLMKKGIILIFAAAGYLVVAWCYVISPPTEPWPHKILVPFMVNWESPDTPKWPTYLFLFAPINALLYAAVAGIFVGTGTLLLKVVRRIQASALVQ